MSAFIYPAALLMLLALEQMLKVLGWKQMERSADLYQHYKIIHYYFVTDPQILIK